MQAGADLDAALIDASRSGDRTAFAQIIERYHRAVYAVSFSSVRDRALADDITQDTFVTAWRRLDDLRDSSRLPAWLCGIARNLGRDARKRLRRETVSDRVAEPIDANTPYEALSEAQSERLVAVALGQIPDVYREPLVLYYYEERSVDDVARSLGISAATTNKRLSRGRQYLAERVATIFEGAVARRGPSTGLAASVLAVIGISVPASHVDASTAPVKGSTMHKLAIAAVVTATLGGGGLIVAATSRGGGDARADSKPAAAAPAPAPAHAGGAHHTASAGKPGSSMCLDDLRAFSAPRTPALASESVAMATTDAATDCTAVGRHLSELEADTTHGPAHRPDEATCDACANNYKTRCETENWSLERRNCTLAAADLINAHLCAGGSAPVASPPPTSIPPSLSCATLGQHIATTVQGAGLYADVQDMHQQVASACELGSWPIQMRQCFAAAGTIATLQACVTPPAASTP